MDVQLKELIETIKKEGVENAEEQSAQIIKSAEEKTRKIIQEAEDKAAAIIKSARKEAAKTEMTGKASLKQAGRDLILDVQDRLKSIFSGIVEHETAGHFDGETLKSTIEAVVKGWAKDEKSDLTVLLPQESLKSLEESFFSKLSAELRSGVEVKPFPNIKAGFRVSEKDGSAYYDFSAESVAEVLAKYLNDRLGTVLTDSENRQES
ncbi:MAG: V-type ATP synthase subunit E [Spirochaetia bacterium]